MMRIFREEEIKRYRELFVKHDKNKDQTISTAEIAGVLEDIGHDVSLSAVEEAVASVDADKSGDVDWDEFVELMERYRKLAVRERRRCCGFDENRLEEFQEAFQSYDKDGSNDIDGVELMNLLRDLNMEPRTEEERSRVLKTLEECGELAEEPPGKTTFWVFLRLMRTMEDDKDRGSLAVERKAAEKAGFGPEEVREFREVFDHWHERLARLGDGCGTAAGGKALTSEGIARILRSLGINLPRRADYECLENICQACDQDGNGNIDFPDFLAVMRRLLDDNFRNIHQHISSSRP